MKSHLNNKLKNYLTAGAGMLAVVYGAKAEVIYTDIPDFTGDENSYFDIDIDNDSVKEFTIFATNGSYSNLFFDNRDVSNAVIGNNLKPFALSSGYNIGPSVSNWENGALYYYGNTYFNSMELNYYSGTQGYWVNVNDKYLGVRFDISGETHYGWIRLSVGTNSSSWTVKDFAYENCADTRIAAGQTMGGCGSGCSPQTNSFTVTSCDSASVSGQILYSSQVVMDTLVGAAAGGCDSILEANVIIRNSSEIIDSIASCGPFTWINGITYDQTNNTAVYTLTNQEGCDSVIRLNLNVTKINTAVSASGNLISADQDSAAYRWLDCENSYAETGFETQSYEAAGAGSYAVEITSGNCVDTSSCIPIVIGTTGNQLPDLYTIYPNPSKGAFVVNFVGSEKVKSVGIYDAEGRLVYTTKTSLTQLKIEETLARGVYTVIVNSGKDRQVLRLMVY